MRGSFSAARPAASGCSPIGWTRAWPESGQEMAGFEGHDHPMTTDDRERADLLETLAKHRGFLRQTVQGLTDEQAAQRTTISELCLGGLVKHVADCLLYTSDAAD